MAKGIPSLTPPEIRRVYCMGAIDNMKPKQIAEETGHSVSSIWHILNFSKMAEALIGMPVAELNERVVQGTWVDASTLDYILGDGTPEEEQ